MKQDAFNQQEYGLDFFKLIASLFVVGMHTEFLRDLNELAYVIADHLFRFAVPFFFMCSGYLFEKHRFYNKKDMQSYIKKYIKNLFFPFVIWGGIYAIIDVVGDVIIDSVELNTAIISKLHQVVTESPGGGMWYIYALIWMMVILYLFYDNRKWISYISLIIFFGILFFLRPIWKLSVFEGTFISEIKKVYNSIFVSELTFLFHMFFLLIGILLAKNMEKCKKIRRNNLILALFIFYALYYSVGLFQESVLGVFFYQVLRVIITSTFFLLSLTITRNKYINGDTCVKMRKMSTIIYFTHFLVIYGIRFWCKVCGINYYNHLTVVCIICWIILSLYAFYIVDNKYVKKMVDFLYP